MWHELIHMYLAGYLVTGFSSPASTRRPGCAGSAGCYVRTGAGRHAGLRVAGRAGAGPGRRLGGARGGQAPADEARRVRGPAGDDGGRAVHARRLLLLQGRVKYGLRDPEDALAAGQARPERDDPGPQRGAAARPAAGQRRAGGVPVDGGDRHRARAARRLVPGVVVARRDCRGTPLVLPGGDASPGRWPTSR